MQCNLWFPVFDFKGVFYEADAINGFMSDINIFCFKEVYNSATQRRVKQNVFHVNSLLNDTKMYRGTIFFPQLA